MLSLLSLEKRRKLPQKGPKFRAIKTIETTGVHKLIPESEKVRSEPWLHSQAIQWLCTHLASLIDTLGVFQAKKTQQQQQEQQNKTIIKVWIFLKKFCMLLPCRNEVN